MEYDKAIVFIVIIADVIRNDLPIFRCHIGGINQGIVSMNGKQGHFWTVEFRHTCQLFFHKTGHRDIAMVGFFHANSTASVGNINMLSSHRSIAYCREQEQNYSGNLYHKKRHSPRKCLLMMEFVKELSHSIF